MSTTYLPNGTGGAAWRDGETGTTALYAYGAPSATAYSGGELSTISSNNGDSVGVDGYAGGAPDTTRAGHRIRFQVPTTGATQLDITIVANASFAGSGEDLKIYIGNGSAWELLDTESAISSDTQYTLTGSITVSPDDYVDGSGYVYVLVFYSGTLQAMTLNLEFAELVYTGGGGGGSDLLLRLQADGLFVGSN